jgi:hypothetical protein
MTDKTASQQSRRKLLKVLFGSGAALAAAKVLPEKWTRPVIEAVSLPAHAQTTTTVLNGTFAASSTAQVASNDWRLLDLVIEPAMANFVSVQICLNNIVSNVVSELLLSIGGFNVATTSVPLPFNVAMSDPGGGYTSVHVTGSVVGDHVEGTVTFKNSGVDEFADYVAMAGPCGITD